ncbi:MAG: hypothetical protein LBR47_03885 [Spirochaetaceae bacterium]|jgi:hypothetical protein|nr:hypothetical protein [Spirochaetaceae bacterium]
MKRIFPAVIVMILFIGAAVIVLAALGVFPLTGFFQESGTEKLCPSDSPEEVSAPLFPGIAVSGLAPYFAGAAAEGTFTEESLVYEGLLSDSNGLLFSYTEDHYGVECSGPGIAWDFRNTKPFIFGPMVYSDILLFADAAPSILAFDIFTGELLYTADISVFPGGRFSCTNTDTEVLFEGRDGNTYLFVLTNAENAVPDGTGDTRIPGIPRVLLPPVEALPEEYFTSMISPSETAWEEMVFMIQKWLPLGETDDFDAAAFYPLTGEEMGLSAEKPVSVYLCYPEESGVYTAGIRDRAGKVEGIRGFVAVFNPDGGLLTGSTDYTADIPRISISLVQDQPYYFIAGLMESEETGGRYSFFFSRSP